MLGRSAKVQAKRAFSNPRPIARHARRSQARAVSASAGFAPPTVSETKQRFLDRYNKPVAAMYNTVVQELLVQHHFMRHNKRYKYDPVFALGISSVFAQILDDMTKEEADAIFDAYIEALDEKPATYKQDAAKLTELAEAAEGASDLEPSSSGTEVQKILHGIKERAEGGEFFYTRFFAIGLFRLLEITGARDPKALEGLVSSLKLDQQLINKDLLLYKSILSKMNAAKELMKEFLEREQRKQKERDAAKAKAESDNGTGEAAAEQPEAEKASA